MRISFVHELEAITHESFSTVSSKVNRAAYSAVSFSTAQWHDYTGQAVAGGVILIVLIVGCVLCSWIRQDIKQKEEEKAKEEQERVQLDQAIVDARKKVEEVGGRPHQQFGGMAPIPEQQQFGGMPPNSWPIVEQRQSEPYSIGHSATMAHTPTWGFFPASVTEPAPYASAQLVPNTWPGQGRPPMQSPHPQGPSLLAPAVLEQAIAGIAGDGNTYRVVDMTILPPGVTPPAGGYTIDLTQSAQPSYQQQNWR